MFHRSVPHLPSRDPISRGEAHDHEYRHFLSLVNQPSAGEESFVGWQEEVPLIVTIHQLVLLKVLFWSWWIAVTILGTSLWTTTWRERRGGSYAVTSWRVFDEESKRQLVGLKMKLVSLTPGIACKRTRKICDSRRWKVTARWKKRPFILLPGCYLLTVLWST